MNKLAMFFDLLAALWSWFCLYCRNFFEKFLATFVK